MTAQQSRDWNQYSAFIKIVNFSIIATSAAVLAGWFFNIPALINLLPAVKPMSEIAAICFILTCFTLILSVDHPGFIFRCLRILFPILIMVISTAIMANYCFHFFESSFSKNMPFINALNFFIISFIFLLNRYLSPWASQGLSLLIFFLALLPVYNYLFETNAAYALAVYTSMSIHSALSFMGFSLSFLLLNSNEGITEIVLRKTTGGYYLRRILPLIFFVPMIVIILENQLEKKNLIEEHLGDLVTAAGSLLVIGSAMIIIARRMDQEEAKLKSAQSNIQNRDNILQLIENGKSINEVGEKILKLICQMFKWDIGEIWLVDEEKNVLRFVNSWHDENKHYSSYGSTNRPQMFNKGEGFAGKIWHKKDYLWLPDFSKAPEYTFSFDAKKENLNSAFGIPVIFQDKIYGVINFFSYQIQTPDEEILSQMNNIGKLMGEFIYRTHTNAQIQSFSRRDILTGLLNRSSLEEDLDKLIQEVKVEIIAVIIVDIDKFKMINQALGHDKGDLIIKSAAKRLEKLIDQEKTHAARLGADKFILYYFKITSLDEVHDYIRHIEQSFKKPFNVDDKEIFLTVSMGITVYPEDGVDSKTLITNADQALANAKKEGGKKSLFFTKELSHVALDALTMHIEMHQAIKENQFSLSYQPQVDLKTNKICGAEALVRWRHPSKGIVSPSEFISYAEQAGLIVTLNEQIMRMVFQQINSSWTGPPISVNISAKQFKDKYHLVEYLEALMSEFQVNPKHIELEVTESLAMEDSKHNISVLSAINQLGFQVAIDDFGTGFSSFSYLYRLPAHKVKIDKSFITGLPGDHANAEIVKSIIALLHSLGRVVVAEGAETHAEVEYLKKEQCDIVQGYYYYKPMSADEFIKVLKESS